MRQTCNIKKFSLAMTELKAHLSRFTLVLPFGGIDESSLDLATCNHTVRDVYSRR